MNKNLMKKLKNIKIPRKVFKTFRGIELLKKAIYAAFCFFIKLSADPCLYHSICG